jgi:hypothetical protein
MTSTSTATHPNALNSRVGQNLKTWYAARAAMPGTTPEFLSTATALAFGSAPTVSLKTSRNGGSSAHLRRGWADKMIDSASLVLADQLGAGAAQASARAFDIANRMMGLGCSLQRVGSAKDKQASTRAATNVNKFVACVEFDSCQDTQLIFAQMARVALRGASNSTHLALHASYGKLNGYRGTHMMVSIDELLGADLRVDSVMDARGASVHVYATIDGARFDLVSFKRKGGDGPSERYPDQLQATLLTRGARAAGSKMASTVSRRVTSRSILETLPMSLRALSAPSVEA